MLDAGLKLALRKPSPSSAPSYLSSSRSAVSSLGVDTTGSRGVHPLFQKKLNQFVKRKKLSPLSGDVPSPRYVSLSPSSPFFPFIRRATEAYENQSDSSSEMLVFNFAASRKPVLQFL